MTRRLAVYLAALAICLVLCVLFVVQGNRPKAPAVLVDLPYPGSPASRQDDPSLFESKGPASPEVVGILAGSSPVAVLLNGRGVRVSVKPGDAFEGGTIAAITQDAVVWESPEGTVLLKPPAGETP